MTDETTARDRAMALITVADADYADALDAGGPSFAARIVDALCAHPEVLRALAGAPTADVAGEQDANRCPDCGMPLRACCYTCPAGPHDDGCEGVEPEGVDAPRRAER